MKRADYYRDIIKQISPILLAEADKKINNQINAFGEVYDYFGDISKGDYGIDSYALAEKSYNQMLSDREDEILHLKCQYESVYGTLQKVKSLDNNNNPVLVSKDFTQIRYIQKWLDELMERAKGTGIFDENICKYCINAEKRSQENINKYGCENKKYECKLINKNAGLSEKRKSEFDTCRKFERIKENE